MRSLTICPRCPRKPVQTTMIAKFMGKDFRRHCEKRTIVIMKIMGVHTRPVAPLQSHQHL